MSRPVEEKAPAEPEALNKRSKQRPPTSADVARLANVSRATVYFVLNDVPDSRVGEETRRRVLAAANELGYVPHAAASALRAGRNQLVLIPFTQLPYSRPLNSYYDHIAERLTDHGYTVMFHKDRASGDEAAKQWAALRPAAVFIDEEQLSDRTADLLHKAGVRAILPMRLLTPGSDGRTALGGAGVTAAEHLIAAGHRRIGVVVPRDPQLWPVALPRLDGAQRVAEAHGATVERIDLALDEREGFVVGQKWRRNPHPSGVFAYNDEYSMMLMRALLDSGLDVPGDVAIVGCDNLPICQFMRPRLTSILAHLDEAGRIVADRVHDLIEGRNPAYDQATIRTQIIIRESG